ncbi:MAG: hypothetical protein PHR68_02090 [Candidatus Gracilibacteria bacterium]|nr:hypothetical protein [Candidatus Gracilibacteria bacterium]
MNTILSERKKIDMIFSYLFSDKKTFEEEDFWNKLSKKDLTKLEQIDKEETFDFASLTSKVLGK